ncbi:MAG: hypothetical protein COB02_13970 [Candidatus Cloacimonadota bacterium]|nr:MAG: hypothetical protein COB02_13970 [Candidatus Cloacimonadota bacterium]
MLNHFLQLLFRIAILASLIMTAKIFVDHLNKQSVTKNEMKVTKIIMMSLPMAIEKYKESHNQYPNDINQLIPELFEKIPGVNYINKIPQKIKKTKLISKSVKEFPGIEFEYSLDMWNGDFCKVVYDKTEGLYKELGDKPFCHNDDLFSMKKK